MEMQAKMFNRAIEDLINKKVFKNVTQCAKALNTQPHILSKIRNGTRGVPHAFIESLIELGYTPNFLYGFEDEDEIPLNINYVPIDIHAGNSKANISEIVKDNQLERFRFPSFMNLEGELFAFKIKGDSMDPTIKDGDLVICREFENLINIVDGNVYVILYEDEFVVKRLKKIKNFDNKIVRINLISDNQIPEYSNRFIEGRSFEKLKGNLFSVLKIISIKDISLTK